MQQAKFKFLLTMTNKQSGNSAQAANWFTLKLIFRFLSHSIIYNFPFSEFCCLKDKHLSKVQISAKYIRHLILSGLDSFCKCHLTCVQPLLSTKRARERLWVGCIILVQVTWIVPRFGDKPLIGQCFIWIIYDKWSYFIG
jgi:hypothetical protein